MRTRRFNSRRLVAVAVLFAVLAPVALCADKADDKAKDAAKTTKKEKDSEAKKAKDADAKPRGRLPAYYRQVVDDAQRDKIYAIQHKYRADRDKIGDEIKRITSDLRKQLGELKDKQDKEIAALLTDEQLSKVEKLRAAALAERKKAASEKKAATKKPAVAKKKDAS